MKRILITFSLMIISVYSFSQIKNETIQTETIKINHKEGLIILNISKTMENIIYDDKLDYYWYNEYSLLQYTKGGAGGNLLHGKYESFDTEGRLVDVANFYLGLKDGIQKSWDENREIIGIYNFDKGKMIYSKQKSEESSNIIEWNGTPFEIGSIKKTYTSYGQLIRSEEMLKSLRFKVEEFEEFDSNNKVKKMFYISIGRKRFGDYYEYYNNGEIKVKGQYENDRQIGEWKWYKEDNSIDFTEDYRIYKKKYPDKTSVEGSEYFDKNTNQWEKTGLWIWRDENGKMNNIEEY